MIIVLLMFFIIFQAVTCDATKLITSSKSTYRHSLRHQYCMPKYRGQQGRDGPSFVRHSICPVHELRTASNVL